jgi:hypothetical protein
MITDPRFAPRRNDLPWLRRRRAPKAAPPAAAAATGTSPAAAAPVSEFLAGHTHGEHHHEPTPTPTPTPTPAPAPAATPAATPAPATSSLDLDEPARPVPATPAPAAPAAPSPASSSLDLDEPATTAPAPTPPAPASSSLDLDEPARPSTPVAPAPPSSAPTRRVAPGERLILTPSEPTATLTRLQSGIGALTIEAAASDEVGDLRLGTAYELASDLEMIMQMTQGPRLAPPGSKRPVILGSRERFERVSIDLRQCRELRRMVVYAFSEGRQPLKWGGTLVVTTFGGARIEVPMDSLQGGDVAVLLSIYQVRGEFVLRAEMQSMYGDVREACRAYGYDKITWLDGRTPVE